MGAPREVLKKQKDNWIFFGPLSHASVVPGLALLQLRRPTQPSLPGASDFKFFENTQSLFQYLVAGKLARLVTLPVR